MLPRHNENFTFYGLEHHCNTKHRAQRLFRNSTHNELKFTQEMNSDVSEKKSNRLLQDSSPFSVTKNNSKFR